MAVNGRNGNGDRADPRLRALYRQASREEPPAHLDRSIAAAARQPSASVERQAPWWTAWRVPFAVAALAAVSVSLVALMVEEDRDRALELRDSPPVSAAPDGVKQSTGPASAPTPHARSVEAEPPASDKTPEYGKPEKRRTQDAAQPDRARVPQRAERTAPAPTEPLRDSAAAAPPAVSAPLAPAPLARSEAPAAAAEPQASAHPPAAADQARSAAAAREERPAAARGDRVGVRAGQAADIELHVKALEREPPASWVERVLALRKEGRAGEADALLAELKRRHPGYELPAELR